MHDPYIVFGAIFAAGASVLVAVLVYFDRRKHPEKKHEA
jgi:hypothetical protein